MRYDFRVRALSFMLLLCCLISGCSKNYSGQYISFDATKTKVYKDSKGKEINENMVFLRSFYGKKDYEEYYSYNITRSELVINQKGANITGNLIYSDGKTISEFTIKTGYIDSNKLLHLQMANELGMVLNCDQESSKTQNELVLKISGSFSNKTETVRYERYNKEDTGKKIEQFKQSKILSESKEFEAAVKNRRLSDATMHKGLIESLGGTVDNIMVSEYQELKKAGQK